MYHGSLNFVSAPWFLPKRLHTKARSNLSPTSGGLSFEHPRHPLLLHLCSSLWYPLVINHDLLFADNIYVHGEEKNARAALPTSSHLHQLLPQVTKLFLGVDVVGEVPE